MKPTLQFLSTAEIEKIHLSALRILQDIGMKMPCNEALDLLKEAGAEVGDNNIVKIPARLVDYAIENVPKRKDVVLYGRDPKNDISFVTHDPVIASMTMATHIIDPYTRKRRLATNDDLAELTRVVEQLEHVKINGALITPQDVPGAVSDWYTWATSIKNTTKHITGGVIGARGVRDAAKMASIAVGGEDIFRERPFISGWVLTLAPLGIDSVTLEALIEMARWNIPSIISSGPIVGITSPVTLAGTAVQAHAEILSCIVVSQLANPGAPVIYTSFARSMDMKTGGVCMSSPEFGMLKGIMSQMGDFLNLPTRMPGMLRDAKILDAQAGFETGLNGTITALCSDIIEAMQFDMDIVVDYADLIYCNECMGALKRVARELVIDDSTLAYDVIKEVGHGGSFLKNKHTFKNFRKELWQPQIMERRSWAQWEKDGCKDICEVSLQKAIQILESEQTNKLLPEADSAIDSVVEKARLDLTN